MRTIATIAECVLLAACGGGSGSQSGSSPVNPGPTPTPSPPIGNALPGPQPVAESAIDRDALQALITGPGQYLTFTCTPWGSGTRIGIDRDLNGVLDGDQFVGQALLHTD